MEDILKGQRNIFEVIEDFQDTEKEKIPIPIRVEELLKKEVKNAKHRNI